MGGRKIFHDFLQLAEIEGHFTHVIVTSVYETQDWNTFMPFFCCLERPQARE
jgi:hypothetical protein